MKEAFKILREIKAVVMSTSENNIPHSRIIDLMHYDDEGLYFLTCKIKPFYKQLISSSRISITAMNKDYVQVRIDGYVKPSETIDMDFIREMNPPLKELFPEPPESYEVFHVYKGKGEIFDLSGEKSK